MVGGKLALMARRLTLAVMLVAPLMLLGPAGGGLAAPARAQSLTTGALSGVVKDPSGASIPGAKVTATNEATGTQHSAVTQVNGSYLIPLLQPGKYTITVGMTGFQAVKQAGIGVQVSTTGTLNFKLQVGSASQTVQVTGEAALLQPQNANTTTTLDTKAIENLPNPGGDITMLAQIAPGAVMHVQGGGGTAGLSFNGVQGNAVNYTVDGMDDNDPFNNDNNSGPSNMLLGSNAVAEVSVNTASYSVDQGRMAAGQVNYLSKSGGNSFHGNAGWQWNGRTLNAYDFFVKSQPLQPGQSLSPKPFDNVNNWVASVGGPIVKNKLFFFVDSEGTRIDLPHVSNFTVPSPAFETYAASELGTGGYDTDISAGSGRSTYRYLPAAANEAPFMAQIFKLYGDTSVGTRGDRQITPNTRALFGCNLLANGSADPSYNPQVMPNNNQFLSDKVTPNPAYNPIPSDTGCETRGILSTSAKTPETLTSFRIDWTVNQNNTVWSKYSDDQGTQTTGVSSINPVFDENSFQPDHQGVLDWTHVFSPSLTNDASTGFLWYSAIFDFDTPAAEHAAIDGLGSVGLPTTGVGSTNFPQGRNVTQYEFIDNMTWTHGSHSLKLGENFRRELVNDHGFGRDFASSSAGNWSELMFGAASSAGQRFPITTVEQYKSFALDLYFGDTWQFSPTLTFTYGVRATHNSNPVDRQPYEGNFADWTTFGHGSANIAVAPNSVFTAQHSLWSSVPYEIWQPRLALAWQPYSNTLIKIGWGMFSSIAASSAASTLANNPPFNPSFTGGLGSGNLGAVGSPAGCTVAGGSSAECGTGWDPTQPGSAVAAAAAANVQYQANFAGGASSCAAPGVNPLNCVPQSSISALPAAGLLAPVVYQYNLKIQQQISRNFAVNVGYVGTRSQHNSYTVNENGYQTVCSGCFTPFIYSSTGSAGSPDPRFNSYSQTRYDGYGRYDSLQAGAVDRMFHGLTLNFNYTFSKCMTTGTPYFDGAGMASDLSNTYALCSDDITQVANASYTYALPFHHTGLLGEIANNWRISGSTFAQGGTPVFVGVNGGSSLSSHLLQRTGPVSGLIVPGVAPYSRDQVIPGVTQPGDVQWFNPLALASIWDPNTRECYDYATGAEGLTPGLCQFNGNNAAYLRGPDFQWTNFELSKTVQMTERIGLRLNFDAYNLFNHPNFSNPSAAGNVFTSYKGGPNRTLLNGPNAIDSLTSPNNGLLGQNGGDSNPRMIALQAKIVF
ncbi:MAG: carboxypeptidase regulatory-like domain-containing protein [Terriglobales bacterium]